MSEHSGKSLASFKEGSLIKSNNRERWVKKATGRF